MSLTTEGFTRPRLAEIKTDYDGKFSEALGPVNTAPDAVVGQIIGIFAAALDDAYEVLQDTYDSMYPSSAEGVSLDGAVSYVGLTRIGAAPTAVVGVCYGTESTLIPAGALATSIDGKTYACTTDTVISRANLTDCEVTVTTVTNSAVYQIIAGGTSVTFTSDGSALASEITAGLAAAFNPAVFTATPSGSVLRIRSADGESEFTLTVDSKLSITKFGSPAPFTALENGAHALPVGALNAIGTTTFGWDSVTNLAAGAVGRDIETDTELRARHASSLRVSGAATVLSIKARMVQEVDSVSYAAVYENRTDEADAFGLPPHSIEVVVSGGSDTDVAYKLYEVKPAGIETYGATTVIVSDENGDAQSIKFSRAADVYAWVRVSVNLLNTEEPLSESVAAAIKSAVMEYGDSLSVGNDIIVQRIYGPIYTATSGIGSITVEAAVTALPGDTPSYSTSNVSIARAGLAVFAESRIVVVGV